MSIITGSVTVSSSSLNISISEEYGSQTDVNSLNEAEPLSNDWETLAKLGMGPLNLNHPIEEIRLRHGWIVDGFEVKYRLASGLTHTIVHGSTPGSSLSKTISLGENEVVFSVTGRAGWHNYYGRNLVHQWSFVILDKATGRLRVEGPYGGTDPPTLKYKDDGDSFCLYGPITAFRARDCGPSYSQRPSQPSGYVQSVESEYQTSNSSNPPIHQAFLVFILTTSVK
ncbi:hypothetical protein D9757_009261 [Collybiopsis confluens]|uniref:Jacalin-type lectin domain-containing protein n=1 Tax=Collybiopsis confluens TaxID=2823264 RepID=A0A8H5M3M6_9AGAR|nr:hypothetical protein D9757_009261 [Collybiopsis confluens]